MILAPMTALLLLTCPHGRPLAPEGKLQALEVTLNEARPYGTPIVLHAGDDFEDADGAVLFLTRDEGARRLVGLARAGKDEVSVIFMPCWNAWIVDSVERTRDTVRSDDRYGIAALQSQRDVEYWHTHNALRDEEPTNDRERREAIMAAMVPSDLDLLELFAVREEIGRRLPGLRGVVAGVLGTVTFWSDDLGEQAFSAFPGLLPSILASECKLFLAKAKDTSPEAFASMATHYRGIFWYRFQPVP